MVNVAGSGRGQQYANQRIGFMLPSRPGGFHPERRVTGGGRPPPFPQVGSGCYLDVRAIERTRIAEVLVALRCAVVLVDSRTAIVHLNKAAEHMLRHGYPITRVGGALGATPLPTTAKWHSGANASDRSQSHAPRHWGRPPDETRQHEIGRPGAWLRCAHAMPMAHRMLALFF
jgi:hypothetical protein